MKKRAKTEAKPQARRRRLDQLVGRLYFTMVLHPFSGWIRVGKAYGSREAAESWVPFVRKAWRGCRAKVETFRYKTVNGAMDSDSAKVLSERYNMDTPNTEVEHRPTGQERKP